MNLEEKENDKENNSKYTKTKQCREETNIITNDNIREREKMTIVFLQNIWLCFPFSE